MRAHLSRRYHLSAAHRLHADSLTEAENLEAYGKCNNPFGHGHNYGITVTISGEVDKVTGMLANLADLDAFAREHVIVPFDHRNLNLEPAFAGRVPTTENFAVVLYEIFARFPGVRLEQVHVEETSNNSIVYAGKR